MDRIISTAIAVSLLPSIVLAIEPCASDFDSFLLKFESEQVFQRQNTRFPLSATYLDSLAEPEPRTVTYKIQSVSDDKYSRVDYPSKKKQVATPLEKIVKYNQGEFWCNSPNRILTIHLPFVLKKQPIVGISLSSTTIRCEEIHG